MKLIVDGQIKTPVAFIFTGLNQFSAMFKKRTRLCYLMLERKLERYLVNPSHLLNILLALKDK